MKPIKKGKANSLVEKKTAKKLDPQDYRDITLRRKMILTQKPENVESWFANDKVREIGKKEISKHFEKLNGENNLLPVEYLYKGSSRALAVCRIVIVSERGSGYGTGFLLDENIILTNNHVLRDIEVAETSYAEFFFEENRDPIKVSFQPENLFMTDEHLDFTFISCNTEPLPKIEPIKLLSNPTVISKEERVSIIQHPKGRKKEIALQDSKVTYIFDKVLQYETDTQAGSSGSPVFNKNWDLVALHHAGWFLDKKKTRALNEGIRISAIIRRLKEIAFSQSTFSAEAGIVLNLIDDSSPILGFFDVDGLVKPKESSLEVEIPTYRGDKLFADVMFMNIEHFNDNASNARINKVAKVISNLSMDVMGLTEVEKGALDRLIKELVSTGITLDYEYLNAYGAQDLAILYDKKTVKTKKRKDLYDRYEVLLNSKTESGKSAFPSGRKPLMVECTVKENGSTTFLMIVVHLKAFGDIESKRRRKLASYVLSTMIADIRQNEDIPIVLGGDFNQVLSDTDILSSLTSSPDLITLTADDNKDNAISYVGDKHRSLIDHIIVSKDMKLGAISNDDAAIVRLDRTIKKYTQNISDHTPVVCRIIYKDDSAKDNNTKSDNTFNGGSQQLKDCHSQGKFKLNQLKQSVDDKDYYDKIQDAKDVKQYYGDLFKGKVSGGQEFQALNKLVTETHINFFNYKTARHKYLYPIVDLHPNMKLKSIYKGGDAFQDPEVFMEMDYQSDLAVEEAFFRFKSSESDITPEREMEFLEMLEVQNGTNCEHVVCQSWFGKIEPMKSDLHHLFACESGCNSSRNNLAYIDFSHYKPDELEGLRKECGFRENDRFEPESGKGTVARATLFFLLRYPGVIQKYTQEDIDMLINWHNSYLPDLYELHRNASIYRIQGNRNPLIDFPKKASSINFRLNLSLRWDEKER